MEFLKEVLGEELFNEFSTAVTTYNKKPENKEKQVKVANLESGQYVDKGKYDTAIAEKVNLEGQIKTLNTTITTLKKDNEGNEALQTTITKLQGELKKQQSTNEEITKTYALKEQLSKAGVLDPEYLIYKHGGIEKFTFDKENHPVGVDDVLKSYKEDTAMAHLFKKESNKPPYNPAGGGTDATSNPFAKETYNMTEQAKLLKSNPEQAKAMAAAAGVTI